MFPLKELLIAFVCIFFISGLHFRFMEDTQVPLALLPFFKRQESRSLWLLICEVRWRMNIQNVKHTEHTANLTPRLKGNTLLPWWEL